MIVLDVCVSISTLVPSSPSLPLSLLVVTFLLFSTCGHLSSETKFLVPDWGIKSTVAYGCRTGPPAYVAWQAGMTILCQKSIISPQSGTKNLATGPFIMQQQLYRSLCSQHLTFTINVFIYCHYILCIFLLFWCELYILVST
jgi:hypothetical protein